MQPAGVCFLDVQSRAEEEEEWIKAQGVENRMSIFTHSSPRIQKEHVLWPRPSSLGGYH